MSMKSLRLARSSPSPNICVFCLAASKTPKPYLTPLILTKTYLPSDRRSQEPAWGGSGFGGTSDWSAGNSLTAAEEAERDRLRKQRSAQQKPQARPPNQQHIGRPDRGQRLTSVLGDRAIRDRQQAARDDVQYLPETSSTRRNGQPWTDPVAFRHNSNPNDPSIPITRPATSRGPAMAATGGWNLTQVFDTPTSTSTTPPSSAKAKVVTYEPTRPTTPNGTTNSNETWVHLRKKGGSAPIPPVDTVTKNQHQNKENVLDSTWVDQAFERHRKERDKQARRKPNKGFTISYHESRVATPSAPSSNQKQTSQVCFRCGLPGHGARDCPGPGFEQAETSYNVEDVQDQDAIVAEIRARRMEKFSEDGHKPGEEYHGPRIRRFEEKEERGSKRVRNRRAQNDDDVEDDAAAIREEKNAQKAARKAAAEEKRAVRIAELDRRKSGETTPVTLSTFMSVAQLAQSLNVHYDSFVEKLEDLGYDDVFPGKILSPETSGMIAMEFNYEPVFDEGEGEAEERDLIAQPEIDDKEFLPTRPPVVTIMGHVDHGKTTILDYIRKSSVAAGEAGGITQHIGAFSVPMTSSGKTITFLDTPGHAAFLAMRQRGANVTDIVVLVVAADDSVKPQTLEALKHAKAAGVPIIVAVNKIDKEEADLKRVKQDLARYEIDIEDYGGETQVVPVSGKTGQGMDDLEETIVALSEVLDQRAPSDGVVEGWILEAETKKSGRVATVLVRRGTLRPGTILVAGKTWTRVRTLRNEGGRSLREAGPGMPVEVDGWRDQPIAGDEVLEAPDEQKASDVVAYREEVAERAQALADMEAINEAKRLGKDKEESEEAAEPSPTTDHMQVPFIIKADVSGSAEAVSAYILSISHSMISPQVLSSGVGQVYESDIELAAVTGAHIVSFSQPLDENIRSLAAFRQVNIIENNIIYRVLEDVKTVLEDRLPPLVTQRVLGEAEIGAAFEIGIGGRKKMMIAGCKIRNGVISRNARVRVLRKEEKIYDGTLDSLKNVKKDVDEMRKGTECGMGFANWQEFQAGDIVQTYEEISEKRRL